MPGIIKYFMYLNTKFPQNLQLNSMMYDIKFHSKVCSSTIQKYAAVWGMQ